MAAPYPKRPADSYNHVRGHDLNWFLGVLQTRRDGEKLLAELAKNAPLITTSHTAAVTAVEDGEADATPTAYGYYVASERRRGMPVAFSLPNRSS